ncbi:MAG: hypothetical protein K0Q47_151 [Sedimentibacter sp.]|jgi:hypothetical protein|nr:hypothetical protein [Sedimentibacter sp.]
MSKNTIIENLPNVRDIMQGEFRDVIRYKDGRIEERPWQRNLIVNDIIKAIACALKGDAGIKYWAIGKGLDSWDDVTPPAPAATDSQLVQEIGRKALTSGSFQYVDGSGNVSTPMTNRLLITVTFGYEECNGNWREFSIVGGSSATATLNTGVLLNHKTHGLIVKTNSMEIERQIRFTFNN